MNDIERARLKRDGWTEEAIERAERPMPFEPAPDPTGSHPNPWPPFLMEGDSWAHYTANFYEWMRPMLMLQPGVILDAQGRPIRKDDEP